MRDPTYLQNGTAPTATTCSLISGLRNNSVRSSNGMPTEYDALKPVIR